MIRCVGVFVFLVVGRGRGSEGEIRFGRSEVEGIMLKRNLLIVYNENIGTVG